MSPHTSAAEDSLGDFLRLFDAPSTAPVDPVAAGEDHQRTSDTHQAAHLSDSSGTGDRGQFEFPVFYLRNSFKSWDLTSSSTTPSSPHPPTTPTINFYLQRRFFISSRTKAVLSFFAKMSAPLNSSHPGALVSGMLLRASYVERFVPNFQDSIENYIREAEASLTAAISFLQAAKNSLQLVGRLSGRPGTLLSTQERHGGLAMGHRQLESSAEISREAIESLKSAVGLMTGR
ncbi:hypothetical protein BBP40_004293 [Aspergillus hancockii]|nr:hypothetical protein BBP40_004293 [Aspergillus hancockii]